MYICIKTYFYVHYTYTCMYVDMYTNHTLCMCIDIYIYAYVYMYIYIYTCAICVPFVYMFNCTHMRKHLSVCFYPTQQRPGLVAVWQFASTNAHTMFSITFTGMCHVSCESCVPVPLCDMCRCDRTTATCLALRIH